MPTDLLRRLWRLGSPASPVPVVAVAAAAMLAVQLAARTIHDVDIFWQLKLGDLTLRDGLPTHEPLLAGQEDVPHVPVAWLAQVTYALVRQAGGWPLLWLVDAGLWLGGFVAAAGSARRGNRWPVAVGLWVGWFAAVPFASVRPQSFGALAFGLLVLLARANVSLRTTLLLGGPLLVLWQNLHPSVAVGVAYLGAAAAGELVRRRYANVVRLGCLLALAAAATVCTPAGFALFRVSAYNAEISRHLRVSEWLPMPWSVADFGTHQGWPMVVASLVMVLIARRRLRTADVLPVLVLTAMTCVSNRFILFWGIAVVPLWADALRPVTPTAGRPPRIRTVLAVAAWVIAAGVPLVVNPAPFAEYYPFGAVRALRTENVRGTVYANYYWGGLVADDGHPDRQPTYDGRYYLFSVADWERFDAERSGRVPLADIEARWRPAAFLLWPGSDDRLIALLRASPDWREAHAEATGVVFVRR